MSERAVKLLNSLVNKPGPAAITGEVVKVKADGTCSIKPGDGGPVQHGVRLRAAIDGEAEGFLLVPATGSEVCVLMLDEQTGVVVSLSKLDYLQLSVGTVVYKIDKDGFLLKRGSDSLHKLISDLLTFIEKMTFSNGGGVTGPANNVAEITGFKQRSNNLLKDA